jgi:hypothetical protein
VREASAKSCWTAASSVCAWALAASAKALSLPLPAPGDVGEPAAESEQRRERSSRRRA